MKWRISAFLLALMMLLSSCASKTPDDTRTTGNTEASTTGTVTGTDTSETDRSEEEEENIKNLTDTDTPDKATQIALTYDSYDRLGMQYADGALGALYDGNINSRLSFYTPNGATSFNTAKLGSKQTIRFVKLFCAAHYERNIGLELQASVNGIDYITLYTLTDTDTENMKNAPLVVEISDKTEYLYFRIYHKDSQTGYDLNEVELYGKAADESFYGNFISVTPVYETADSLGTKYIYGDKAGDTEGFGLLWDKNDQTRICYYTWDGGTSFNTAKFESATVIAKLRLISKFNQNRNEGVQIRASRDGVSWTTLYTVTAGDVAELAGTGELEIVLPDSDTLYWFIQVYHENSKLGYDLNGLDVYTGSNFEHAGEGEEPPMPPKTPTAVSVTDVVFGDENEENNQIVTGNIYGTKAGSAESLAYIWDGKTDTNYGIYTRAEAGSYTMASFSEATVISGITLATIWQPAYNIGTAIQVSVDGQTWVTLHVITAADGSFAEGTKEWKLETLEIPVTDSTAYNYIRIYDTAGNGYCLAEVTVYTLA